MPSQEETSTTEAAEPASTISIDQPLEAAEPTFKQKANCLDCSQYWDCPKMRGEEICYGYLHD